MGYDVRNAGPDMGDAPKYCGVKPVNVISSIIA